MLLKFSRACLTSPADALWSKREDTAEDRERYQTLYGRRDGAVAAPTAGLHFDQTLLDQLDAAGIPKTEVTLHVGAGTFQPMRLSS